MLGENSMIPQEMTAAVARGLREAFGVTECEDIRRITKGRTSALVFRIIVRGSPYLLRIITFRNSMLGPGRHFTCMRGAAEAGLAPRVWYTSLEDQISITDFVEEAPFPAAKALVQMPAVLRNLHALPPFPRGVSQLDTTCMFLLHKGPALDGFTQKIRAANLLPKEEIDRLFAWHAEVAAVYPQDDAGLVSSHNDLFKPDNILFDGRRVWLVDWEAAFLNDPYADLAVVANLVASNDAEERIYLERYFGQPPDEYQLARFFLMQQIVHMFYGMAFLLIGSGGKPVDHSAPLHDFRDFHRRFWAGDVNLVGDDTKIMFGRIHCAQLAKNTQLTQWREALRIVSDHHRL